MSRVLSVFCRMMRSVHILCMLATSQNAYMKFSYFSFTLKDMFMRVSHNSMPRENMRPSRAQTPKPILGVMSTDCIFCSMPRMLIILQWPWRAHHSIALFISASVFEKKSISLLIFIAS